MRALPFSYVSLNADMEVKQAAATKQMDELVERLNVTPKYHTLTKQDYAQLRQEGYASDLIDNLITMTQRQGKPTVADDKVMIGFTYAAFDPALYSNLAIRSHLENISIGCCCYCESFLLPTDSGMVSHYRPVQLLDKTSEGRAFTQQPSPYFSLAYEQSNWVYCCRACSEKYQAGVFPIEGKSYPEVLLEQEKPLLINPYHEEPRDFIRFNPRNGEAYAYDHMCDFYRDTQQLSPQSVESLFWEDPCVIPDQWNTDGEALTDEKVQARYDEWQSLQTGITSSRGQVTIATLGLNRPSLVLSRLTFLKQFTQSHEKVPNTESIKDLDVHEYYSLAFDALHTWQAELNNGESKTKPKTEIVQNTSAVKKEPPVLSKLESQNRNDKLFPVWLRSCLFYLVEESELEMSDKRRLVLLSSKDRFYGKKSKEKCVFLPIDWQGDTSNIIKVRSYRNVWESSFEELADTRPQELLELFANNDIWVEGDYAPLAS